MDTTPAPPPSATPSTTAPSTTTPSTTTPSTTPSTTSKTHEKKKNKPLVTTSPAITTSTIPTSVPEGYEYFSEGSANILYKDKNAVFYNPVQEFNRDMSIMMIKLFQDLRESEGKGRKIKVLEALTATGLRSVRYAKEIPDIEMILSNDIDEAAVDSIRKNAEFNGVTHIIHPNIGDASLVMMQNRSNKFDVVDLDPYGSPTQFLDPAVQCIADGGLLCVTATDMAVLCGSYPATCFTKYGSVPIKAKHCHEMGLRILLHCISTHAAKYKKYVVPLLSISVDFYCRIFMRVYTGAGESNAAICKYSHFYQCSGCDAFHMQPLGKHTSGGNYNANFGPVVPQECPICARKYQMGGPIWSDPTHDKSVLERALKHLEQNPTLYNTSKRLYGLITAMHEELEDQPLFLTMPQMCNVLHVSQPSMVAFRSALVAQGYKVSISHTEGTAVKTNAPMDVLWDIMRSWVKLQPHKPPSENSPAFHILSKEPKIVADFTVTKAGEIPTRAIPRFLPNPKENWGPGSRATGKNKRTGEQMTLAEKRAANQNKKAKKQVCQHFLKGTCKFGDECKYLHTTEGTPADSDKNEKKEDHSEKNENTTDPNNTNT
eukprot:Phypoly_transcript_05429.p1 GENE.Phypoly_transcript_05429~~Phypoly_transcript_05429.p1  ORF type:complete len:649 (+),score=118.64 Phypoly_transcript_05429:147-1949(+)